MEKKAEAGGIRRRKRGQSMAEYALIIALVAIAVIGAVTLLGERIAGVFTTAADTMGDVGGEGGGGGGGDDEIF